VDDAGGTLGEALNDRAGWVPQSAERSTTDGTTRIALT
jgi:hypothetical protein